MNHETARTRLSEEKEQLRGLLGESDQIGAADRAGADEQGDWTDSQPSLTDEEQDDAVAAGLRLRLAAVTRALARLDDGTYGASVRSGAAIPEARLEADPAAELTADEALEG
jgi:DnaK suppressor protein